MTIAEYLDLVEKRDKRLETITYKLGRQYLLPPDVIDAQEDNNETENGIIRILKRG
jgi:hypothetical protein